jgi:hypothetical protein
MLKTPDNDILGFKAIKTTFIDPAVATAIA